MLGYRHTEETKAKLSNALTGLRVGNKHPMYGVAGDKSVWFGRKHTEETKERLRIANTGENGAWFGKFGKNHPSYGRIASIEEREKMSKRSIGKNNPNFGNRWNDKQRKKASERIKMDIISGRRKPMTEEQKKHLSKRMSGENNHNFGKPMSDKTKDKLSKAHIGKHHTIESKARMSKKRKGSMNANAKDEKYYNKTPVPRSAFKTTCYRLGWNFDDFSETFVEWYNRPSGGRYRKYVYKRV